MFLEVVCWKGYCDLVQAQFINTFNFLRFKKEGSLTGNCYYLRKAIIHQICLFWLPLFNFMQCSMEFLISHKRFLSQILVTISFQTEQPLLGGIISHILFGTTSIKLGTSQTMKRRMEEYRPQEIICSRKHLLS